MGQFSIYSSAYESAIVHKTTIIAKHGPALVPHSTNGLPAGGSSRGMWVDSLHMNKCAQYAYSHSVFDSRQWISFIICARYAVGSTIRLAGGRATHTSEEATGFIAREIKIGEAILIGLEVHKIVPCQLHSQTKRVANRRLRAPTRPHPGASH